MAKIKINAKHAIYQGSDIDPYYDKNCDRCAVKKIGRIFSDKHLDIATAKSAKSMFGLPCVICEDCRHINKLRSVPRQMNSKIRL